MLDLRSLHYVVTLSRRLSFARAADDLGISQPALTRAVQVLEARHGVRLFDRDRAGVRLTAQGRSMIAAAAELVGSAEDLERQWDRTAKGEAGAVSFGMAPMPARALLAPALSVRLGSARGVRNDVMVRNVEALWPLLIDGDIEFFVAAEGQVPDAPPVREEVLGHFPVSLIVGAGHPLLSDPAYDGTFPVLVSSRAGRILPPDLLKLADGPPHVIEDFATLAGMTVASDAIWQSSVYAVGDELAAGVLQELPRAHGAIATDMRIILYSLERRTQSTSAKSLAQLFRQRIRLLASRIAQFKAAVA